MRYETVCEFCVLREKKMFGCKHLDFLLESDVVRDRRSVGRSVGRRWVLFKLFFSFSFRVTTHTQTPK